MFSTKLISALAILVAAATVSAAGKVEHPSQGETWVRRQLRTIQWSTEGLPQTNMTGDILLGYLLPGSDDQHLDYDHPVAKDVPLLAGMVVVPVPDVQPGTNYIIEMFGSPEYTSDTFTILDLDL
ncbi:hypothetical protein BD413DRAFT_595121 [Trametes elegans]|nr:hypothetical protein BD413DRAFT_595121 [Trametes elegans]